MEDGQPTNSSRETVHSSSTPAQPVPRWLWIVLGIVLVAAFLRSQKSDDDVRFWAYVTQCAHDENWEGIYDKESNPFAFAPYANLSMTAILYPLGYLPRPAMRLVMAILIMGMWWVMYRFMTAGIADSRLGFRGWIPLAACAPLLGMILAGRYLLNDLNCKQLNIITFGSGCAGLLLMLPSARLRKQALGAVLLGFSIGLKLTTVPLLAMLLIKRAWRNAALVAACSFGFLWLLPHWLMGSKQHLALSRRIEGSMFNMWLQVKDTEQTWSFANFLHYRIYIDPLWPSLSETPPHVYQLLCVAVTLIIGLPALHVMLRRKWSNMDAMSLWEEVAMIGVAWALIDPDGRTHHYVTLVPAFCYVMYRRLEAWHQRGEAPRRWQWCCYLAVGVTNLWLLRFPEPYAHHVYMHYGLYSGGLMLLYGLTYGEILLATQSVPVTIETTSRKRVSPTIRPEQVPVRRDSGCNSPADANPAGTALRLFRPTRTPPVHK